MAWIAAAATIGAAAISYLGSQQQAGQSKFAAQKQMDFQERMSNTAH